MVPPRLMCLLFNMIWEEEGKLEVEANLGKRLVSLDLDINFPDDFAAELALLCDIRRLKVGNEVNGRPGPAPADRVPARRKSAHKSALSAHTSTSSKGNRDFSKRTTSHRFWAQLRLEFLIPWALSDENPP